MPEIDARQWTELIEQAPHAHLLQTAPWGDLKASFGWTPVRVISPSPSRSAAGAQVLFRRLLPGLTFAYLPKGPLWWGTDRLAAWNELLPELDAACRRRGAVFLKVEPDEWEPVQAPAPPGFTASPHPIQPRRTLLVDLRGSDEELLARMKQKTRYNIRLSLKKGVLAHPSSDLDAFYRLIQETGGRDQFGVHSYAYYRRVYDLFHPTGLCELFLASHAGEPLAGLLVFARGSRAYYFYGASASQHRERMPTYLLQWESMRWARSRGCQEYDLWGVPDEDEEILEQDFSTRSDGLWGVYRFKRGFGGQLCRSAAPLDRVYIRPLYRLYMQWVKRRGLAG
jgi:peptidoglycan pentaglycine glycine transferase (the first glycine)